MRGPTVARPGVEALLAGSASRRLTLVSAGPGWGKTTAVARWARSSAGPRTAWLTLEPSDERPAVFWSDLVTALRDAGAVPRGHPLDSIRVSGRLQPGVLRRALAALEALPAPSVLVLDDVHHVGPDVAATIDDLLRYPLPLHLVVLTRADPPLALHRLRGQGEVAEIGAAELAFDATEVESLATAHGRSLHGAELGRLLDETGGWAAGVRLRIEAAADLLERVRADRSAAEFLLAEVLDLQPPPVRRFLLRTSVVPTLCTGLASALDAETPAAHLLPALAAADGFVTSSGEDGVWYRYHPLLRQMLEAELGAQDPVALREAHRAAARWYAAHDEPLQALDHAATARDWHLVGDVLVEGAAAELAGPHREAIAAVLATVPYERLDADVRLHLCAGALAIVDERYDAAREHVARARALLTGHDGRTPDRVLLELLDASVARATGDVGALATAAGAALALADGAAYPFPALGVYRAVASAQRATGLAWCDAGAGDGGGGASPAREVRASATGAALVDLGARAAAALRSVADGRLDGAAASARDVVALAEARGWDTYPPARAAHAALAWVDHLRATDDGPDRRLALALAADAGGREPAAEATVRVLQAHAAAARGHARTAVRALAAADRALGPAGVPPLLADLWLRAATEVRLLGAAADTSPTRADREPLGSPAVVAVQRARELLAADDRGRAARRGGLAAAGDDETDDLVRVEAALVEASASARSDARRVGALLARALDLASAEQLARPFLTIPVPALRPALVRAVATRGDAIALRLRAHLEGAVPSPEPAPLVEPLTDRELAVLAVLPTMESNAEIAADLFVSVNTVKAHLKSAYRKLGVGTRRDAVRRGRELGLLP
ncbi:LuxR C-terminal-related transcriptional regulator [Cellulosimicrobium sp. CUA-896]|uniref:LuxR C-terminal-related transcriptional regulator n=1 Tax=Cellulosimicrobium sp. CUA-896 TaxID=1517881 RepID=UPI00111543FE|nr:LuxR C-terminal-related transcriptional regulator [Cellulosimicrobium sp. CUA-896]